MNTQWHGIMKIFDIKHLDVDGTVLWSDHNIYNLLHSEGELFILKATFWGGKSSSVIPDFYYMGLDDRMTVAVGDTLASLAGEPSSNGYVRQGISSNGAMNFNIVGLHWLASSPIVAFRSTTGPWGPVQNVFLTDTADNSGSLIATAVLSSPVTVTTGQSVTLRIGIMLQDCTPTT